MHNVGKWDFFFFPRESTYERYFLPAVLNFYKTLHFAHTQTSKQPRGALRPMIQMKANIGLSDLCDPLNIKKEFRQTVVKAICTSWDTHSTTDVAKACREVPAQQGEHEQHILEAAASDWTQEIWLRSPSNQTSCGRPGHCSDYRDQNFSWLPYFRRGDQTSLGEEIKHCLYWGKSSRTLHSSLNHTRIRPDISYLEAQFFFSATHKTEVCQGPCCSPAWQWSESRGL